MIDQDAIIPDPQIENGERIRSPLESVDNSNRDVITAIYATANELPPTTLIQETNGSKAYIHHAGLIRLVYDGEREEAEKNVYGLPVNPAVDKLSELVASGKVAHERVPVAMREFRPSDDPLYEVIDKAWGSVFSFTDKASGEVICYSVKVDTHSDAETVLVSPKHVIDSERLRVTGNVGSVATAASL